MSSFTFRVSTGTGAVRWTDSLCAKKRRQPLIFVILSVYITSKYFRTCATVLIQYSSSAVQCHGNESCIVPLYWDWGANVSGWGKMTLKASEYWLLLYLPIIALAYQLSKSTHCTYYHYYHIAGLLEGNVGRYFQQEWSWYWAPGVVTRVYARWLRVWGLNVGKDTIFLSSRKCPELAMWPTKPSF